MKDIRCLLVSPNEEPVELHISEDVDVFNYITSPVIRMKKLINEEVFILYNEHKGCQEQANRIVDNSIIYKDFILINYDEKKDKFVSLSDKELKKYHDFFNIKSINKLNDRIIADRAAFRQYLRRVH